MDDFFNALPRLIWHEDEPIAWPSSVSLYFVSKLAARAGEGGAHRRRQRRTVRRLRALSLEPAEPAWRGSVPNRAGARCAASIRSQAADIVLLSAVVAPQAGPHVCSGVMERLESLFLDNFYCAFSAAEQSRHAVFAGRGRCYGNYLRYWNSRAAAPRCSRACSTPTRRPTWSNC